MNTSNPVMMTPSLVQPGTSGTVRVAATEDETQTTIAALLSLGSDIPPPDAELDKNVPSSSCTPGTWTQTNPTANWCCTNSASSYCTAVKEEQKTVQPKSELINEQEKKTFVTVEYKLKQKYVNTKHKFRQSFTSQKEVNNHFRSNHPPLKCDICQSTFNTPAAMMKHYICTMSACMNVIIVEKAFISKVNWESTYMCTKLKVIGPASDQNVERDLSENPNLMLIWYPITRRNTSVTNVPTQIQTLEIWDCTNESIVTGNHSCAQNAVKGLNGYNKDGDIWIQMNARIITCEKWNQCSINVT